MDHEIELILEKLRGTSPSNTKDLLGFDSQAIGALIHKGRIVRVKERSFSGTISEYYIPEEKGV